MNLKLSRKCKTVIEMKMEQKIEIDVYEKIVMKNKIYVYLCIYIYIYIHFFFTPGDRY